MSDCITDDWKLNVTPVVRLERPKKTFVHSVYDYLTGISHVCLKWGKGLYRAFWCTDCCSHNIGFVCYNICDE